MPSEIEAVEIVISGVRLRGDLGIPRGAKALVLFAHGSGSSRLSPRNTAVGRTLRNGGIATLLFDLLTEEEDSIYERRFDIVLLAQRLVGATRWVMHDPRLMSMPIGYFGASTSSAAALRAAAELGPTIRAVVSRGGRPDLAMDALSRVHAPALLIVGGNDGEVIELNRQAFDRLPGIKHLSIIPGATHLFEEPGALDEVARLARDWFLTYLVGEHRIENAA